MVKREEIIPRVHDFLDGMVEKGWTPVDYAIKTEIVETVREDGSLAIYNGKRTLEVVFDRPEEGDNAAQR